MATVDRDVLILGAGPAGMAAGLRARQDGLSVTVLEANTKPRRSPGETLHPGIEPLLGQLGVLPAFLAAGFPRHEGIWLERDGARTFTRFGTDENGPWRGFQADRRTFNRILQDAAVAAGVEILPGIQCVDVLRDGTRVVGVQAANIHYRARWTLDATGSSAWLAERMGLPVVFCSPTLVARYGWDGRVPTNLEGAPIFTFRDDGWDWRAPLAGGRAAWVELRIQAPGRRTDRGIDQTWYRRPDNGGEGYFLLGDAATRLDPASSHGVLKAIMSGIHASHVIGAVHARRLTEGQAGSLYGEWVDALFAHDVDRLKLEYESSPAAALFMKAG